MDLLHFELPHSDCGISIWKLSGLVEWIRVHKCYPISSIIIQNDATIQKGSSKNTDRSICGHPIFQQMLLEVPGDLNRCILTCFGMAMCLSNSFHVSCQDLCQRQRLKTYQLASFENQSNMATSVLSRKFETQHIHWPDSADSYQDPSSSILPILAWACDIFILL